MCMLVYMWYVCIAYLHMYVCMCIVEQVRVHACIVHFYTCVYIFGHVWVHVCACICMYRWRFKIQLALGSLVYAFRV